MFGFEGTLSEDQWVEYYRKGYLKLGRTLSDAELKGLRERIDQIMLGQVDTTKFAMQLDGGGDYSNFNRMERGNQKATLEYRKIQGLEHDDRFHAFMSKPLFREACARVYGAHVDIVMYRAMFMNKPAKKGTHLPWHQDAGEQWGLDRDPELTVWTALDPATKANGCVKVVPGSHHLGLLSKHGHVIDKELEARICTPENVVYLELAPGESVLLHNWMLHASEINTTEIPRRAFSVCYMDGRTRSTREKAEAFPVVFKSQVEDRARETSLVA